MTDIRIWVCDSVLASGVMGPIDVFTSANAILAGALGGPRHASPPFSWRVESIDGKPVRTASGQILNVDGAISACASADAVVIPGPFVANIEGFLEKRDVLKPLFVALGRQRERGALLASSCSGSFVLAEAGLLDGRSATTHWALAGVFKRRYPAVDLRAADVITEHGRIICSGAVTTYLDLAIRLVEKFAGSEVAAMTARLLLIDTDRISQTPYMTFAERDLLEHSDALVARAQRWMERHLQEGFSLPRLARRLAVSERTLNRRFRQAIGDTPLGYVQSLRIAVAKRLLEANRLTVDRVSERVGYGDLSAFRELFKRETGVSPRDYQRRFARRRRAAASG
jgi:transcriptional regulator GlxA family with amidase domain